MGELLIGRDADCAVKYDEDREDLVSRRHVKIVASPTCSSGFNIVDLQSRNGTFVNKQRIATPTCLQHLDVVQLGAGGPEFRIECDPPPVVASRPTRIATESELSPARMTREASLPVPAPGARPVGRFTVERMLGESFQKVKRESNKTLWVGVASIIVVFGSAAALFLYLRHSSEDSIRRAVQQQVLLQKLDEQAKAAPLQEAQMKQQIAQLGDQLKAAQAENRKEFSQLVRAESSQPAAAAQSDPNSAAYDKQLQVAVQQFVSNDLAGTMNTCAALIRMDGNRWEAYALAGRALNGANKQDQAKGFFLKAQQLAPADTKQIIQQMIDKLGTPPA